METLTIIGIALVAAIGVYLVVVGALLVPDDQAPTWRRRRKGLGIFYLLAGMAPLALGLLFVLVTAFGTTDPTDATLDGSFAAGIYGNLDDSVWYLFGGWLTLGGAVIAVGAICGRRGWPLARTLLALGLLLIGVPSLLLGVGLIYLLIPTLFFWRHEQEPLGVIERASSQ